MQILTNSGGNIPNVLHHKADPPPHTWGQLSASLQTECSDFNYASTDLSVFFFFFFPSVSALKTKQDTTFPPATGLTTSYVLKKARGQAARGGCGERFLLPPAASCAGGAAGMHREPGLAHAPQGHRGPLSPSQCPGSPRCLVWALEAALGPRVPAPSRLSPREPVPFVLFCSLH